MSGEREERQLRMKYTDSEKLEISTKLVPVTEGARGPTAAIASE